MIAILGPIYDCIKLHFRINVLIIKFVVLLSIVAMFTASDKLNLPFLPLKFHESNEKTMGILITRHVGSDHWE